MNTNVSGIIGILTSPFLAVDSMGNNVCQEYYPNSVTGAFGLIYITGFWAIWLLYTIIKQADTL